MGDLFVSFAAILAAAVIGSYVFRFMARQFGQKVAFGVMVVLLGAVFAIQTYLEKG